MTRAAIGFVVGVTVGLAIGFGAAARREPVGAVRVSVPASGERVVPVLATLNDASRDAPLATTIPSAAPIAVSLGAAIAAIPEECRERGTGRITGVARTAAGEPIPGVRVKAVPPWSPERGEDDVEARVRDVVRRFRRTRDLRAEACTDAAGAFVLDGLAPVPYSIDAELDGWSFNSDSRGSDVEPGQRVAFTGSRVGRVAFDVRRSGGAPPAEATIELALPGGGSSTIAWERANPCFTLGWGTYEARASAGHAEASGRSVAVTIPRDDPEAPVVIDLAGKPRILGRLVPSDEDEGSSLYFSTVLALARANGGDAAALASLRDQGLPVLRDQLAPEFWTLDLRPGRYLIGVARRSTAGNTLGRIVAHRFVDMATDPVGVELALPPLGPEDGIRVHVVDATGGAIADASVDARAPADDLPLGTARGMSGGDPFVLVPPEVTGMIAIAATARGYANAEAIVARATPQVTLTLAGRPETGPARLLVHLVGFVGGPLEDAESIRVDLYDADGRSGGDFQGVVEAGDIELSNVRVGRYDLVVEASFRQQGGYAVQVTRVPVTIHSGANEVSIPLPTLAAVTLLADGPGEFTVAPERDLVGSGRGLPVKADATGRARIARLAPGTYTAAFMPRGAAGALGPMTFTIPGPDEIRYAPGPLDALRVNVRVRASLAALGLAADDVIVAVDGATLEGGDPEARLRALAGAKPTIALTVLRGGGTLEVEVSPAGLFDAASLSPCASASGR